MTWTSTLAWCAASSAFVAVPLLFRLSAVKAQRDLYRAWWERDSGKMIVAQAELDLIREQRREAGRQSHKAERALFRETAERIASLPAQPLRPRNEIEAEVAAIRAARRNKPLDGAGRGVLPASSPARGGFDCPSPLSHPAGAQRPGQRVRSGAQAPALAVRTSAPLTRRGQPSPAETPKHKGGRHATR